MASTTAENNPALPGPWGSGPSKVKMNRSDLSNRSSASRDTADEDLQVEGWQMRIGQLLGGPTQEDGGEDCGTPVKAKKSRKTKGYYREQAELLDNLREADQLLERNNEDGDQAPEEPKKTWLTTGAMALSLTANVFLFLIKVYAAATSGSLAVLASAIDSMMDLLSGLILWLTARQIRKQNFDKFPVGKGRMEPIGIIVFSTIMSAAAFQVISESVQRIIALDGSSDFGYSAIGVMATAAGLKFLLWLLCRGFKSPSVRAYAQDHFNDSLTNAVALVCVIIAFFLVWWVDPVGAILMSSWIIFTWSRVALSQIRLLVGGAAPKEVLMKLTYLSYNHHPSIQKIDTVRAFHCGVNYWAEVDIVLSEDMPLRQAHDIGESLQIMLENLEEIDRAFVHLDWETDHHPHSEHKMI